MKRQTQWLAAALVACTSSVVLADARVTVGHFAPFAEALDATSVSVVINGETALEDVKFKDFTGYIDLPAGDYTIDIVPTGSSEPAITGDFTLEDMQDYTVFATGDGALQDLQLIALADDNSAPAAGNVKIRVVHAAPFADTLEGTEVSIRTAGGEVVGGLQGVPFGIASGYLELPADTYDLKVASNDGTVNFIDPLPVALSDGTIATLFAVGNGTLQPLGIIAVPVGELPLRAPVNESAYGMFTIYDDMGELLPGLGFNFVPLAGQNRVVGAWLTYSEGEPTFFTFDSEGGGFDGETAATKLYSSTADGESFEVTEVGSIIFGLESCNIIMAEVTIGEGEPEMFEGRRITPSAACNSASQ